MGRVVIPSNILSRIASGDQRAFEELYRLTYKPLYAFLLTLTRNHEDAKDLLQETFIKVHGSAHLYKSGNPMAWIMTIAKNLFLMEARKGLIDPVRQSRPLEDGDLGLETLDSAEDRMLIQQLFSSVSDEERTIVVLHAVVGLKHREIASLMGIPLGTVLSKYQRSLAKLEKAAARQKEVSR